MTNVAKNARAMRRILAWAAGMLMAFAALPVLAQIPTGERQVLINLYNSTNGDQWYSTSYAEVNSLHWKDGSGNFRPPGTECQWYGVFCGGSGTMGTYSVILIGLSTNNLTGQLPASLDGLGLLNSTDPLDIRVDHNKLSGPIPPLAGLTYLGNFEADNNQLSGPIPPFFQWKPAILPGGVKIYFPSWLSKLEYFTVSHNQLSGSIPLLNGLSELNFLWLDDNDLSGTIPDLSGMSRLRQLKLSSNQLTGPIPPSLSGLTKLTDFFFDSNQLSGTIPDLSQIANPNSFSFAYNSLTGSPPSGYINATVGNITAGEFVLCPNPLTPASNPESQSDSIWDEITRIQPWSRDCANIQGTTTTITSVSPAAPNTGDTVTVNFTVGAAGKNKGTTPPGGTVSVGDSVDDTAVCLPVTIVNGAGQCALTFASSGAHTLTAVYKPDSNNANAYSPSSGTQAVTVTTEAVVNGACGSDNGDTFATLSSTAPNLCSAGTVSAFNGTGPWTWNCVGSGTSSTTANCSAKVQSVALLEPAVALSFNPASVTAGGTTTLAVGLANPNAVPLQLNTADVQITGLPGGATLDVPGSNPTVNCGGTVTGFPVVIPAQIGSTPGTCTLTFANVSAGTTVTSYTATWPAGVQFIATASTLSVNTTTDATAKLTVTPAGGTGSGTGSAAPAPVLSARMLLLLGSLLALFGVGKRFAK